MAGIHCEGQPHFWLGSDGSVQEEGMNNVIGKLWEKVLDKLLACFSFLLFLLCIVYFLEYSIAQKM